MSIDQKIKAAVVSGDFDGFCDIIETQARAIRKRTVPAMPKDGTLVKHSGISKGLTWVTRRVLYTPGGEFVELWAIGVNEPFMGARIDRTDYAQLVADGTIQELVA